MHIILLKFTDNRHNAALHLPGHKAWLARGLEDGLFLLTGSLGSDLGGAILARGVSPPEIQETVSEDPFVRENIVSAEVLEFSPTVASENFQFLLEQEDRK
jgi:uncharacterized protein YciI